MNARLRVMALVANFAVEGPGGGAERFATALSRSLDPGRYERSLFALWDYQTEQERNLVGELEARGIRCFIGSVWDDQTPYGSFRRSFAAMWRQLGEYPVDILHSHSQFGDVAALAFKASGRVRAIVRTVHNGYAVEWRKSAFRRLLLTNGIYPVLFDTEIGVSDPITDRLNHRPLAKLLGKRALRVANAIDTSRFADCEGQRGPQRGLLGIQPDALVVGTIGRLAVGKGHHYFVQAAARVHAEMPDVRFVIIGDGDLERELKEEVQALGLHQTILFAGRRSQIENVFAALDLYVQPSLWEGMATSVMEAMAAGVPVVATDIPGNSTLIHDGENGWLVPARDANALAEATLAALGDPHSRAERAMRARSVASQYDIGPIAAQHADIYARLVPGAPHGV